MIRKFINVRKPESGRGGRRLIATAGIVLSAIMSLQAGEPYGRNCDYALQHSRIILRFDVEQKKVIGEVIHTLTTLHEDTSKIEFDSVGLTIQSVREKKAAAKFEHTPKKRS